MAGLREVGTSGWHVDTEDDCLCWCILRPQQEIKILRLKIRPSEVSEVGNGLLSSIAMLTTARKWVPIPQV
jgi:hypothetical protein